MCSTPLQDAFKQAVRDKRYDDAISCFKRADDPSMVKLRVDGLLPLNEAIKDGHKTFVEFWLKSGADPNALDIEELSALHTVACTGRTEFIPRLLQNKAVMDLAGTVGHYTPLFTAFDSAVRDQGSAKTYETMRAFVRHGANINILVNNNDLETCARATHIEPLVEYWQKNLDYELDVYIGERFKNKINLRNVAVSGVRRPDIRAANFLAFAVRGDFADVVDYMKDNKITPSADDFSDSLNGRMPLLQVLQETGQLDLIADHAFWQNNFARMEHFRSTYRDQASQDFWRKFGQEIEKSIMLVTQKTSRRSPLKR